MCKKDIECCPLVCWGNVEMTSDRWRVGACTEQSNRLLKPLNRIKIKHTIEIVVTLSR